VLRTYRVVVADDGAGRAAGVARELRDAGFEVIYLGARSPEEVAEACLQEDADAVWPAVAGVPADVVVVGAVAELAASLDARASGSDTVGSPRGPAH
jgi:methylmalonyl-CoA mutase cobalamin-binding domain/chain